MKSFALISFVQVGKKLAEFTAHQAVLASVSPYFMSMFEQDPRTEARKSYNVKETTPEAFQTLLDYAYTGKYDFHWSSSIQI